MSWVNALINTYDSNAVRIGNLDDKTPLLPLAHITKISHIEINLNTVGEFIDGILDVKNIIIPCTDDSLSRTGKAEFPHPLFEKLQYLSNIEESDRYKKYSSLLNDWANSQFSNQKIKIVNQYIKNGTVISDLISSDILKDRSSLAKKSIEKLKQLTPHDLFIRFRIGIDSIPELWRDKTIWDLWLKYYETIPTILASFGCNSLEKSFDIVTGEKSVITKKHSKFLRRSGDGCKIMSSNNEDVFLGRFENSEQASSIGFRQSHKIHNALRWIIGRQGYNQGNITIVAWANSTPIPQLFDIDEDELNGDINTAQSYSEKINKFLSGYSSKFDTNHDNINLLILKTLSPGRLAILYFNQMSCSQYLRKIENWLNNFSWINTYYNKKEKRYKQWFGSPRALDLIYLAYGDYIGDNFKETLLQQIFHCIIESNIIPENIVSLCVKNAANFHSFENNHLFQKALWIACSAVRYSMKFDKMETRSEIKKAFNKENSRSFNYGRLLAVYDLIEQFALNKKKIKRPTNAQKNLKYFQQKPLSVINTVAKNHIYYLESLEYQSMFKRLESELIVKIGIELTNEQLNNEWIIGYHSQLIYYSLKKEDEEQQDYNKIKNDAKNLLDSIQTNSFMLGRLISNYDTIEQLSLKQAEVKRLTNFQRLFLTFQTDPFGVLKKIEEKNKYYKKNVNGYLGSKLNSNIKEIKPKINYQNITIDKDWLLGFHAQKISI